MLYPPFWPKANSHKPGSLQSRITEQQKTDLFNRRITTRALAKTLGVHEKYLSYKFYTKVEIVDKRPLIEGRKNYKLEVALQVLKGDHSIQQAADLAFVSYNTMQRFVAKAKKLSPELIAPYIVIVLAQKQLNIKRARDARKLSPPNQV
jgi:AraC-like DNA-binding protein